MQLSICSFSFHRLLEDGKQDIFGYMETCRDLGCTHLDPWVGHLVPLAESDNVLPDKHDPRDELRPPASDEPIARVKAAAADLGLPFGCLAADGCHIYEEDPARRAHNRRRAHRWIDIAGLLGAAQIRIDAGGPEAMPEESFSVIRRGYADLIGHASDYGMQVLFENHWGPTKWPDNVCRLLDAVDGLGYLFDTNNWADGKQQEGWERCAARADAVHVKTFRFNEQGEEPSVDLSVPIRLLQEAGYDGCWGVESCPREVDEITGARKTIELIRRHVQQ
jgi:sugar phosphate isomerase/epimerase